ncbi:ATP-dependent RNA helicase MAK5 [Serendipita indica DSM 11827]|uniref:RNA helicase n=1 Tax=Serendipita indica (strain DSM 11827) TaxID=1109443 RepID=G4T970_SERID|nr:ATP-dependent RNA helicase MAK5 [Serendipita indica DSM 11827]CCA67883.1 related to MAK5-ATP-dependent RNA helicase [Serendipita indica DSM 11827]
MNPLQKKFAQRQALKRKLAAGSDQRPSKKPKVLQNIDDLDWRVVDRPISAGIDEEGGMLMLEEVEDVEVYYEETPKGKVAKFRQASRPAAFPKDKSSIKEEEVSVASSSESDEEDEKDEHFDELPEWSNLGLSPTLLRRIKDQGFIKPTPIQRETLPLSTSGRDVIGIAQTGSGKTLAFALPILRHILSTNRLKSLRRQKRNLKALIVAPTRELALQVSAHINACAPQRSKEEIEAHLPPLVSVATIVGGMSQQKQTRMLERGADVIVATPGRLWELLSDNDELTTQIRQVRFFVLDEADRMVENGHFAELDKIIRLTARPDPNSLEAQIQEVKLEDDTSDSAQNQMQTFVFSATMSKDLQQNLKRHKRFKDKSSSTIDDLILRLDFRDEQPAIVDLSPKDGVVSTFQESKVECITTDKDAYLYYFLLRYPGRSLIFLSSIDGIRRLAPLLDLLQVKSWPIHSQMEQRQRLKNLDRFKNTPNCALLATDVAARGLDIPAIDHVIHYQVPRSGDIYVHRNGRTARAEKSGFGLLLVAPDERKLIRTLISSLGRKEDEIPELPVERTLLDRLKERINLAREIDKIQHSTTKKKHDNNWLKMTAEALELDLSDEVEEEKFDTNKDARLKALKAQLHTLVSQPLVARGISTKYITSGTRSVADELINGQSHKAMLGLKVVAAQDDVLAQKAATKGKRLAKKTTKSQS